jgi:hypothetical protein
MGAYGNLVLSDPSRPSAPIDWVPHIGFTPHHLCVDGLLERLVDGLPVAQRRLVRQR